MSKCGRKAADLSGVLQGFLPALEKEGLTSGKAACKELPTYKKHGQRVRFLLYYCCFWQLSRQVADVALLADQISKGLVISSAGKRIREIYAPRGDLFLLLCSAGHPPAATLSAFDGRQ